MLYLVVIQGVIGPVNLLVCGLCLLLLFFESAFGICIGCWLYNRWRPDQAQLCPGGACTLTPESRERLGGGQLLVLAVFALVIGLSAPGLAGRGPAGHGLPANAAMNPGPNPAVDPAEAERCKVPEFAKAIGHEEKWKLHNNCK